MLDKCSGAVHGNIFWFLLSKRAKVTKKLLEMKKETDYSDMEETVQIFCTKDKNMAYC